MAHGAAGGHFHLDDNNKPIVRNLYDYFTGSTGGKLDQSKGILLIGAVGSGKTTLMRLFGEFMRSLDWQKGFKVFNCAQICAEYAELQNEAFDKYTYNKLGQCRGAVEICLDELGREPLTATHYGNKVDVMQHILQTRYTMFQESGVRTFATTNMSFEQLRVRYDGANGAYLTDRFREMFNIVIFPGTSRRK